MVRSCLFGAGGSLNPDPADLHPSLLSCRKASRGTCDLHLSTIDKVPRLGSAQVQYTMQHAALEWYDVGESYQLTPTLNLK